jgi:rhodanese-related sulfurtransferase
MSMGLATISTDHGSVPSYAPTHIPGTAGALAPDAAFDLLKTSGSVLVDVRTAEELKATGSVPGAIHVAWQTGPAMIKNPRFLKELSTKVARDAIVLFICRSGKRSADAAAAAAKAGYENAFSVLEGFEGGPGEDGNPGPGWRSRGLPTTAL